MLMVSRAHVLSASRPDFRDIITRQASGIPGLKQWDILEEEEKVVFVQIIKRTRAEDLIIIITF